MLGKVLMVSWQSGFLQSSTRRGLTAIRRTQSAQRRPAAACSRSCSTARKAGRQAGQPMELIQRRVSPMPSRSISSMSISMTSASTPGLSGPSTSAPIW